MMAILAAESSLDITRTSKDDEQKHRSARELSRDRAPELTVNELLVPRKFPCLWKLCSSVVSVEVDSFLNHTGMTWVNMTRSIVRDSSTMHLHIYPFLISILAFHKIYFVLLIPASWWNAERNSHLKIWRKIFLWAVTLLWG